MGGDRPKKLLVILAAGGGLRKFSVFSLAAACFSFLAAVPRLSAQSDIPSSPPLNPAFLVLVGTGPARVSRVSSLTSSGHALGDLPSPFDSSYMTGTVPARAPSRIDRTGYAASYDLRSLGKTSSVKDQSTCGACWTFATMASIESRLLTGESWDFSENNLDDTAGFDWLPCAGGNRDISAAYLSRWSGPWTETADPYTVTTNKQSATYPSASAQKHVQEILFLPDRASATDNDNIKWALTTYGAVHTSIRWEDPSYNATYKSYIYTGASVTNHAVTIVGWDDNFSASNFVTPPAGNGAFIIRNSWGSGWGDGGYFYASYYDAHVRYNTVYVLPDSPANYYRAYQYDPYGQTSSVGYGTTTGWFANVFTAADSNTQVDAVSFYTLAVNSTYNIYVYRDMPTAGNPRSGTLVSSQSGSQSFAGYHTVPLTTKVPLSSGQTFTVVVQMTTPGYNYPIPMEQPVAGYATAVAASAGQSYISSNGSGWSDLTGTYANTNANLKAFTSMISDPTPPSNVATVSDGSGADIAYTASGTQLQANWTAATDAESGIRRYWYAIGTTAGASDTVAWTENGANTSVTKTGLTLTSGQAYYVSVKAENWLGLQSSTTTSNGQIADTSAPGLPASVSDGMGTDIARTPVNNSLSANWPAASDAQSGIAKYYYGIGVTAGGTTVTGGWIDNGTNLSVTRTGLSLSDGATYYFTVKTQNGAGTQSSSVINSNGQMVDASSPTVGAVSDGTGSDTDYTSSISVLSANWTAFPEPHSGILKYWYGIGTSAGATDVVGWTDNGTARTVTRTGLALAGGQIYYFTVKADNLLGLQSPAANSDGITVDVSSPSVPGAVNDGSGADIAFTASSTQLQANWGAASDGGSGVVKYYYAIGTTAGGTDKVGWTDNGSATSVTKTGLSLTNGTTYYFTVKAEDGVGFQSAPVNSNGQMSDATAPSAPASVSDGLVADITYTTSGSQLSANWQASSDAQSGVAKYFYAIGTSAGGTDISGWTDNGTSRSVTMFGLTLNSGTIYYISVIAQNGAGVQSGGTSSNGQKVDTSAPSVPGSPADGTGTDIDYTSENDRLAALWNGSMDSESGVVKYWYAIGTTAGGAETVNWTDNAMNTSVSHTGLSLADGVTYYFSVKAENGAGTLSAAANTDGQMVDASAPAAPASLSDGTGADIAYTVSSSQLSANWPAASDMQSGVVKYWYGIGTYAGGVNLLGWTDNGTGRSVTRTGLSLGVGTTYYFTVKAENAAGLQSSVVNSNGQMVDTSSPTAPSSVNDGTGADVSVISLPGQLSANWTPSSDLQSGVAKYWYAVGTTAGGTDFVGWTNNGTATSVTKTGLTLVNNTIYYFTVKAENAAGLVSPATNSNGQQYLPDPTPPTAVPAVRDGTGSDAGWSGSLTQLSANWDAASDPDSGIARYWYSIGTTAGGTEVSGWIDNGSETSVTRAGLSLADGATYYFSVKAENPYGLQSTAASSNGQIVDATPPSPTGTVSDGPGADISYTASASQLSANWPAFADSQTGVAKYYYAIGTTAGGTEISGWTDNGAATSVTRTGLTLSDGAVYYFSVKAENGVGLLSAASNSNGQMSDASAPAAPGSLNDGTGADAVYALSTTQLSANWSAAADPHTAIVRYWYGIGTTAGSRNVLAWTDNGTNTSVTRSGLGLTDGQAYYFTVKAENASGLQSAAINSNGQIVDISSPASPGSVSDGNYAGSLTQLSASWTPVTDSHSGLARYWYSIGSVAGGSDIKAWTDNGLAVSTTASGLSLTDNTIYYFSVRSENNVGMLSVPAVSDGQRVDVSSPPAPGYVYDGTGADAAYSSFASQLSANWGVATDPQSGVVKYWYAIGSTPGATDILGWTDNGASPAVTASGLGLTSGFVYYFTVKAQNGAGLISVPVNSNGQMVDISPPGAVTGVKDGAGPDVAFTSSSYRLYANWNASADAQSGVAKYRYAIGTTAGGTNISGWTDNGLSLSAVKTGLALVSGTTYYFSVQAENGAGLLSAAGNSDGQMVDTSSPSPVAQVNDGFGTDVAYSAYISSLTANWTASADAQSGIAGYYYAIGTTPGGTETRGWTAVGLALSTAASGLTISDGITYYFSVKAENGAGMVSDPAVSNGQMLELTAPSSVAAVRDGPGADSAYTASQTSLSSNWNASSDAQSGIAKYWYAIGTTAGGTEVSGWTDNGSALSVVRNGLSLSDGVTYYFSVKAENGSGLFSVAANSNGQMVDSSSPTLVTALSDGTGADSDYTPSSSQLSANWAAASDPHSGVVKYWYAIGTTPGGTQVSGWTDNAGNTTVTRSGLALSDGAMYYFSVRAQNAAGLLSDPSVSDGQMSDASSPSSVPLVRDGAGADAAYAGSLTELSANWSASWDPQSGVAKYWYAIGTTAGGTDISAWTDNGPSLSVTRTGLSLSDGSVYYFSVKAENSSGLHSAPVNSNGQIVDVTQPAPVAAVRDGLGADSAYAQSGTRLLANWDASSDPQSGITGYFYAIGTTPGGTDIRDWTGAGVTLSTEASGLALADGATFYFSVKAQSGSGLFSAPVNSNGQMVDASSPTAGAINDGTGADVDFTSSGSSLQANWEVFQDPHSGVVKYWYAAGSSPGGTDIAGWTDNGTGSSVSLAGLTLSDGTTYYFSVKARNAAGLVSDPVVSDGQMSDATPPSAPPSVADGAGSDAAYSGSMTELSANWPVSSDPHSGIWKYWYAIGTTAGGTDVRGWTDNGPAVSTTAVSLSLSDGGVYYFSVKAENGSGLYSGVRSSNGQMVDATDPATVGTVRDGTGTDAAYSVLGGGLAANWASSADGESGISKYWYAVSSITPGGTEFVGWTDNGINTSVVRTGLALDDGATYYFTVRAQNGAGRLSAAVDSDGQMVDSSSAAAVSAIRDGEGGDIAYTVHDHDLAANWAATSDPHSGVRRYWYAIGTIPGGTDVASWTNNGLSTSATRAGLTLADGATFYFSVSAENYAGLLSQAAISDGQMVDVSSPSVVPQLRDGSGVDANYFNTQSAVSANWSAAADPQSGVGKYLYAVGSYPGGTDVAGWTDNGQALSASRSGLSLSEGVTYYFSVIAEDRAGLRSDPLVSDGQMLDSAKPSIGALASVSHPSQAAWYTGGLPSYDWSASDALSGVQGYYWLLDHTASRTPAQVAAATYTVSQSYTEASIRSDGVWYFHLAAADRAGNLSDVATYVTRVDASSPSAGSVYDGAAADAAYAPSNSVLYANWAGFSDPHSGVGKYWYAIGTTAGGTDVAGWTDAGASTYAVRSGLSLLDGSSYYFSVKAENASGLISTASMSNGQIADGSAPSSIAAVRDGLSAVADSGYSGAASQLSANWSASSDPHSGLLRYWYAIGTTPGGTDIAGWTANGTALSVIKGDLSISDGTTYYFVVQAENGAGLRTAAALSNGQMADLTAPQPPAYVNDGIGADVFYAYEDDRLSANWGPAFDAQSGIAKYYYGIGTVPGGITVTGGWLDVGTSTSVTRTGLPLTSGVTYYFSVKAQNGAALQSAPVSSNGQFVDTVHAEAIAFVRDGTGADITHISSLGSLSANWAASSHPRGINRYEYAIGTTAGASNVAAWTSNGLSTAVTRSGLSLTEGTAYYFSVKAYPSSGLPSPVASSDGQVPDVTAPSAAVQITSLLPAKAGPLEVKLIVADASPIPAAPHLAFRLPSGIERPVQLSFLTASTWTGRGYIEPWYSTGTVTFSFSAADAAGNSGSSISAGSTFYIDTSVSALSGGTVVNSDSTTVTLAPGAAAVPLVIITSTVPASRTASAEGGDSIGVTGYDLTREFTARTMAGSQVSSFNAPVTIKMYYPDADNNGMVDGRDIPESLVGIYWLDEVSGKWTPVYDGILKDYAANSVQADVRHFSVYSLRYVDSNRIGTDKLKAYPNPCYLRNGPVTIANIPPGSTEVRIYIYDAAGGLVRTLDRSNGVNGANVGTWDGRNSEGSKAASGVYLYIVRTGNMGRGAGKMAVIW